MGLLNTTRNLVSLWAQNKKRRLQESGTPNSKVDSGGTIDKNPFQSQAVDRGELRDVKEIRESGGVVSHLVHAKALMQFGTGIQFEADDEEIADWLEETFNDIDNLLISLGEDAIWYPYSLAEIVETQAGGFSHVECIEPWTMEPKTNEFGEVVMWEQEISGDYGKNVERFDPDEVASFVLNKSSGRDKTGISEVLRAEQEIEGYRQNAHAINNAIDFASYVRRHVKVGREDGGIIDDNELRRVRNRVDNLKEDTTLVTGPHVEFDTLGGNDFDFAQITEHDLRKLALALGLPLELANVGSDGLGSGMPAKLRLTLFERQARAAQRALADQFVQQIIRPVLEEYSPYPSDANVEVVFGDPVEEEDRNLSDMAPYLTLDEIREKLDKPPAEDEELGKSYRKPANIEAPEEEEPEDGGIGGLFSDEIESALDERNLQDIEDIDMGDYPEAAQENARMALEAREETDNPNDCGTRVGWERANQLDNGEDLSEETISRMAAFERHEDNKEQGEEGRADCGWMMWKAWGGDEGIEWAQEKLDEIDQARENAALSDGDTGNGHLEDTPEWDRALLEVFQAAHEADLDRNLVAFNEGEIPQFAKNRMRDAIFSDAVFSQFDSIENNQIMQLKQFLEEQLTDDRWSLDGLANRLQDLEPELTKDEAETIARTETQSIVSHAREIGYEERGQEDDTYYWVGSVDERTTDACKWLIGGTELADNIGGSFDGTNPNHGGNPVSMERLKELVQEAAKKDPDINTKAREWTPHINCRKNFVRYVE
jgi:hypothetical protein